MKIITINGSPQKGGNTAKLLDAFESGVRASHTEAMVERVNLGSLENRGCIACGQCKTGKIEFCSLKDGMSALYPRLVAADIWVLGTPVYFGQVTGPMKLFIDRLYAFIDAGYDVRHTKGKSFATITVSGAPAGNFTNVTEYLKKWFGGYMGMKCIGSVIGGGLGGPEAVLGQPALLEEARRLGGL